MTDADKAKCVEWLKAHAKNWQTYKRSQWKYEWRGKTLVRFLDNVSMREVQDGLVLEYLSSNDCIETLSLYSQGVSAEWTPVSAWYEIMATRGPINGILQVRLYHALRTDVNEGGDGPYITENGCAWKVSWTFHWHQTSVANIPASSSGINYRVTNLSRDDEDGTFNYVIERRERVQQDIPEYVRAKDAFKTQKREEHKGVKGDTTTGGKSASVSLGKIVTRDVQKNDDCTHDVSNTTVESKDVTDAVTETSVGVHGAVTTTVNRNMRSKASESNLKPGQSVRNEQNEDLTWNQTIRGLVASFAQKVRETCRKTVFRHTHVETTAVGTDPGFTHVESAGGGVIHETDVVRTESGWDKTDTVHTDSAVSGAVVETQKLLDGTITRTINRGMPSPAGTQNMGVGDTIRNEVTDSGLVDQTIVKSSTEDVGRIKEDCQSAPLVHTHSTTRVVSSDHAPDTVEVGTVANGTVVSRSATMTERGAWRVTDETRTAGARSVGMTDGTSSRSTTTTVKRNASSIATTSPSQNVETSVRASINEFGLLDGAESVTVYSPETTTSHGGTNLYDEDTTVTANSTDVNPTQNPSKGIIVSTSASPNGHGSASVTKTVRTAKESHETTTWTDEHASWSMRTLYRHTVDVYRNWRSVPNISCGEWESASVSISINEFGLIDAVIHRTQITEMKQTSGGRTDSQWDNSTFDSEVKASKQVVRGGYLYDMSRMYSVRTRMLKSTPENMAQEIARHPGYPELKLKSGMSNIGGVYVAVIYMEANPLGDGWTVDSKTKIKKA